MSINKRKGDRSSVTEGSRALDLFTDRHELTRLFAEYLNEPSRKRILCFYGNGGNGKLLPE